MKIFITGGSGFIGTKLIPLLQKENHEIVNYDKAQSKTFPELTTIGDIRDLDKMSTAMNGVDAIFHLAAEHADDVRPLSLYYDVNVGGGENLVKAADKNGVKTLIFASTVALYGLDVGVPDEDSPAQPFNDYGKSKHQAEKIFEDWCEADASRSLVLVRPCVIFGEDNRGNVYNLLNQISSGKFVMVGNGDNRKSMGYVRNIAKFFVTCLDLKSGTHIFNFADKPDISTAQLVKTARNSLGKTGFMPKMPYAVGMIGGYGLDLLTRLTGRSFPISSIRIKKFCADTTVSAKKLESTGFIPDFTIEEGLQRMIEKEFNQQN